MTTETCPRCGAAEQATHHPLCQERDGTPTHAPGAEERRVYWNYIKTVAPMTVDQFLQYKRDAIRTYESLRPRAPDSFVPTPPVISGEAAAQFSHAIMTLCRLVWLAAPGRSFTVADCLGLVAEQATIAEAEAERDVSRPTESGGTAEPLPF